MSQREIHANGVVKIPRPAEPIANGSRASHEESADFSWEVLFPLLAPNEQHRLTSLANDHGCIQAAQLPTETPLGDSFRHVVQRTFALEGPDLEPLPFVAPVRAFDEELDSVQIDAVSRALDGADLLLVQGRSGTGKTRTIIEVIRQVVARGQRVLLTAPSHSAVDAILGRLQDVADIETVRCLGKDERAEVLPEHSLRITPANRERAVRESILARASARVNDLDARLNILQHLAQVWGEMLELSQRRETLISDRATLANRRTKIDDDIRREAATDTSGDPAIEAIRAANLAHAQWLTDWETKQVDLQKERARLDEECQLARMRCASLRPLTESARSGRFWSLRFWKAKLDKSLAGRAREAEHALTASEHALCAIREREDQHRKSRLEAESAHAADRDRLCALATDLRRQQCDERLAAIEAELTSIDIGIGKHAARMPVDIERPQDSSLEGVQRAEARYIEHIRNLELQRTIAADSQNYVERATEEIARRWRDSVRLVAGPATAIGLDPWFAQDTSPFNLVIVADAHALGEGEMMQIGRRGKRWAMFGEPSMPAVSRAPSRRHVGRPLAAHRPKPAPDFFARLWDRLHQETWFREAGRLCCRLHRVPTGDRERLESECVADRPEVELRIWNRRNAEPLLAEVCFPVNMSVAAAKEYLFREMGEIPCHSRFHTGQWESAGDCLHFRLGPVSSGTLPPCAIALAEGLMLHSHERHDDGELVFAFESRAGWDRPKAEIWLQHQLSSRDSGRACRFDRAYRHVPPLAKWLECAKLGQSTDALEAECEGAIEFIAVPRRMPVHARNRGGAGIEIDLADPVQRGRLALELARFLPSHGYVNLAEARAIAELAPRLPNRRIAITSPYAAQTELLRHFCPREWVGNVDDMTHAECDLLVVSLTRSHVARAVTYGHDPRAMLRLFSRARCRIIFLGDPGTLARRAQWEGAVDHLDDMEGERERAWVNALLPFLPAPSPQPHSRVPQGAHA